MLGFTYGEATGGAHAGMQHDDAPDSSAGRAEHGGEEAGHGGMHHGAADSAAHMRHMMEMHHRMMADPVIRERIMADSAMRRMMTEMMGTTPSERAGHAAPNRRPPAAPPRPPARRDRPRRPAAPDPHAGHGAPTKPPAPDTGAQHEHGGHHP
jgi:hypothetical protein